VVRQLTIGAEYNTVQTQQVYNILSRPKSVSHDAIGLHSTTSTPTSSLGSSPTRPTRAISRNYSCGKLNGEVARHADILATILARMSVSVSWNVAYRPVKMTGDWRGTAAINGSSRSSGDVQCVVVGLLAVVAAAVNTILFYSERHFAATEINARQQRRKLFAEERSVAWPQESLPIRCAAVCINNGRALCVDYTVKTSVYPRILWRVFHILTQPVPHTFVFIRKRKEY